MEILDCYFPKNQKVHFFTSYAVLLETQYTTFGQKLSYSIFVLWSRKFEKRSVLTNVSVRRCIFCLMLLKFQISTIHVKPPTDQMFVFVHKVIMDGPAKVCSMSNFDCYKIMPVYNTLLVKNTV